MSMTFVTGRSRGKPSTDPAAIQKMLDENNQLIQTIVDYQSKGRSNDATHIQQLLHRNLVYLATLADSNHSSMQQLLQNPAHASGVGPMASNVGGPSGGPQSQAPMGPGGHAGPNMAQVPSSQPQSHNNPNGPSHDVMTPASMGQSTPADSISASHPGGQGPGAPQMPNNAPYKGAPQQGDTSNMPQGQTVSSASNSTPSTNMPNYSESSSNMQGMAGNYYSHQTPQMAQGNRAMMAPQSQAQQMQQPNMPIQTPTSQYPAYPQQQMTPQPQQPPSASPMQGTPGPMMQGNAANQQPPMATGFRPQGQSPYSQQQQPQQGPQGGYNQQFAGNQQGYMPNQQMPRHGYPGNMPGPNPSQYSQQGNPYGTPGQQVRNYNYNQGQQPQGQPPAQGYGAYNQNAYRSGYQQ